MKKTRFFCEKKGILIILLLWLLLLDTAYAMNTEKQEKLIRVLIMDSGYKSYYHPDVILSWQGQEYVFDMEKGGEEELSCVFEGGEEGIRISSVKRQQGAPVYKGTIEITRKPEGFLIVNTLPLEEYLEAVLPSEMPASYPEEALKAQAVCARTYAWKQLETGSLSEYGADVDDSVNYQVYNNTGREESTSRAVQETEGRILCQNGKPIEAYYFSTSSGTTSTDEIWGAEKAAPYLKSVDCKFDSEELWRTWETELSWSSAESRAGNIEGCAGELKGLEVVKKSESGAVTGLRVYTEGGAGEIFNEYEIRAFLSPDQTVFAGKNKEEKEGVSLLPSAYFSLETKEKEGFLIQGSGYGHGVGMSQTAAGKMAEEGYKWEEILRYFFRDVELSRT